MFIPEMRLVVMSVISSSLVSVLSLSMLGENMKTPKPHVHNYQ